MATGIVLLRVPHARDADMPSIACMEISALSAACIRVAPVSVRI